MEMTWDLQEHPLVAFDTRDVVASQKIKVWRKYRRKFWNDFRQTFRPIAKSCKTWKAQETN